MGFLHDTHPVLQVSYALLILIILLVGLVADAVFDLLW